MQETHLKMLDAICIENGKENKLETRFRTDLDEYQEFNNYKNISLFLNVFKGAKFDYINLIANEITENDYCIPDKMIIPDFLNILLGQMELSMTCESESKLYVIILSNIMENYMEKVLSFQDINILLNIESLAKNIFPKIYLMSDMIHVSSILSICHIVAKYNYDFLIMISDKASKERLYQLLCDENLNLNITYIISITKLFLKKELLFEDEHYLLEAVLNIIGSNYYVFRFNAIDTIYQSIKLNFLKPEYFEAVISASMEAFNLKDNLDYYTAEIICKLLTILQDKGFNIDEHVFNDIFIVNLDYNLKKLHYIPGIFNNIDHIIEKILMHCPESILALGYLEYLVINQMDSHREKEKKFSFITIILKKIVENELFIEFPWIISQKTLLYILEKIESELENLDFLVFIIILVFDFSIKDCNNIVDILKELSKSEELIHENYSQIMDIVMTAIN